MTTAYLDKVIFLGEVILYERNLAKKYIKASARKKSFLRNEKLEARFKKYVKAIILALSEVEDLSDAYLKRVANNKEDGRWREAVRELDKREKAKNTSGEKYRLNKGDKPIPTHITNKDYDLDALEFKDSISPKERQRLIKNINTDSNYVTKLKYNNYDIDDRYIPKNNWELGEKETTRRHDINEEVSYRKLPNLKKFPSEYIYKIDRLANKKNRTPSENALVEDYNKKVKNGIKYMDSINHILYRRDNKKKLSNGEKKMLTEFHNYTLSNIKKKINKGYKRDLEGADAKERKFLKSQYLLKYNILKLQCLQDYGADREVDNTIKLLKNIKKLKDNLAKRDPRTSRFQKMFPSIMPLLHDSIERAKTDFKVNKLSRILK